MYDVGLPVFTNGAKIQSKAVLVGHGASVPIYYRRHTITHLYLVKEKDQNSNDRERYNVFEKVF